MPSLTNIFFGLTGVGIGIFLIVKAYYVNHHILFLDWAEKRFGPGYGTITYRWIGFLFIILSMFILVGKFDLAKSNGLDAKPAPITNTTSSSPTRPQIAP
jgi:hypothetical protein